MEDNILLSIIYHDYLINNIHFLSSMFYHSSTLFLNSSKPRPSQAPALLPKATSKIYAQAATSLSGSRAASAIQCLHPSSTNAVTAAIVISAELLDTATQTKRPHSAARTRVRQIGTLGTKVDTPKKAPTVRAPKTLNKSITASLSGQKGVSATLPVNSIYFLFRIINKPIEKEKAASGAQSMSCLTMAAIPMQSPAA